ncbi:MAG: cytosolic protein [Planctomycetes bacterium]|nr:cytosolic protein [Planctomycetota bacterium]
MECHKAANTKNCACTYSGCDRRGECCECIRYHLSMKQLPGCCFPPAAEKTYDRSFKAFAKVWNL